MEFGIFASSNSAPSNPTKRNRSSRAQSGKSVASKDYLRQDENINESNGQESTNNNYGGTILISIVENRAREICIAKINTESRSTLEIYLLTDSHSYSETVSLIEELGPHEVLLHDNCKESVLSKKVLDTAQQMSMDNHGDQCRVLYISRQYFDQDKGADMLTSILSGKVDADLIAKYTVLAGSYCLLRYVENCDGINFAAHSVRLVYGNDRRGKLSIDRRSSINLELISNVKTDRHRQSLYGTINCTKTVVGARLLKASILRPCTDIATIDTRLDMVELLLHSNQACTGIVAGLKLLPDLDKMLAGLTSVHKQLTPKTVRSGIDTLIFLKQTLKQCPSIIQSLLLLRDSQKAPRDHNSNMPVLGQGQGQEQGTQASVTAPPTNSMSITITPSATSTIPGSVSVSNALLEVTMDTLRDPCLLQIQALIDSTITESTVFSKSSHEMKYQECFAVRPGLNGMLDVARKAFLQSVEEIHSLAEEYAQQFQISVKVTYTVSRGYFLIIPADTDPLPGVFTQAVLNKKSISCSTAQIASLASRAMEAMNQALIITNECIQSLMEQVREHMEALFSLTDCVALLDMLTSFADLVSFSPRMYTRPRITPDGPLVIHSGRHPVLADMGAASATHSTAESYVPNDVYFSPLNSFQVITGPNGSGKTVFIKQVTLITILAQIGCFIPARHGTIPIRDRILTRLGTSDDIEHNLSSFMTEMKETTYILNNLTPRSLVIIDELGRGTSNIDGLSLAFAIAEAFVDSEAYCMFVTHYTQITSLASMYPNVSNIHLKVALEAVPNTSVTTDGVSINTNTNNNSHGGGGGSNVSSTLRFTHQVGSGPSEMKSGYGILMSEICGFPSEMVAQAREIQKTVRNLFPLLIHVTEPDPSVVAVSSLLQHLLLLKNSSLSDLSLVQYLNNLRCKLSDGLVVRMQKYLSTWSSAMTGSVLMNTTTTATTAIANTVATTAEGTISYTHMASVSTSTKHDDHNSAVANNDITPVSKLQKVDQTASIKPVVESLGHGSSSSIFDF